MSIQPDASTRQFLCLHAIDTLPDSTADRRRILCGIIFSLPQGDPIRTKARTMLKHMDAFDAEQKELPLPIDGKGDGDGQ